MRNLKKLFAVVLAVAMLASMMVPALAANTYGEEALKLQAINVFAGGPADLKLDEGVTRIQGLAFAIRAAGKDADALALTDAEADAILADWTDADTIPAWGRKYAAYAIENKITVGLSATEKIFGAMNPISGTSFLVFLMKSGMGYADVTTADVVDAAIEASILTAAQAAVYADKAELIRDDAAGILYGAFTTGVNNDGTKLIDAYIASGATTEADAAAAGFVEVLGSMSVKAIGARKLEVKFNKAADSDKAKFEVKRGTVKPSVKEIKFAEDKKSAVIEFSTDMAEGDYTVNVTGLTDEALTATVKVEAAKLTVIRFLTDVVIIKEADGSKVATTVVAENQYGEDVSSKLAESGISVTASKGTTATVNNKGLVELTGAADTFKADEKVVITIVDSKTATVASKTLTIAKAAAVESIEFGTLKTDNDDLKGKEINVEAMTTNAGEYYLPITVKDQYGNVLKAGDLSAGFSLLSSNEDIVKLATTKIVDTDDGTVIKFQTTGKTQSGTVVITAVATGTGKTANTTIVVKDNAKIDTVTISAPEAELKIDVAAVLPVEVVDTYGAVVKLNDAVAVNSSASATLTFKDTVTKLTATNATFTVEKDYVKDVTTIKVKPTDKNVIITVTTANGKYQSLTLTASDKPVVTSIKGLKADFATMMANNASLALASLSDKIEFLDQYGDKIDAPVNGASSSVSYYTVAAKDSDNDKTTLDGLVIKSSANAGTETYVVKLFNKDAKELDSFEFSVTVVEAKKITAFGIDDLNKFYTGTGSSHGQTLKIHGLVDGKKVIVPQSWIVHVTASNGLVIGTDGVYAQGAGIDTDGADKASVLTVLVNNTDATFTATKDALYSDADPVAQALVIKNDGSTVEADVVQIAKAQLAAGMYLVPTGTESKLQFTAKDQYGVQRDVGSYTFVTTQNDSGITVSSAGQISGTAVVGKSIRLNVFIDGLYKTIKVIVAD